MKLTYVAYSPLDLESANSIQTFNTCRALAGLLGSDLTVIVPSFGGVEQSAPFRTVRIPRIPLNKLTRLFRSAAWSYLERTAYAWLVMLYLLGHSADLIYVRDVICAFWLVTFGAPVIYEVHDLESRHPSGMKGPRLVRLLKRVDARAIRGATALVSLTRTFKDEVVKAGWQPAERIFVIPDAFDETSYYPQSRDQARKLLNLATDGPVIGYAGMTFAYRRLDLFLEALRIWDEPLARALIIGGRPNEVQELKRRARELGVDGKIVWRGREPAEATACDLSAADILVIPETVTEATASPLKMFEYMALGRAIVAVDRPALREILAEGTAEFFRPGDPADLARVLGSTATSAEHMRSLGARALECVREYTYAKRAGRIISACKAAL